MAQRPFLQGTQVKISADIDAFQKRLGHQFSAPELLLRALTHSSISSPTRPDNQRLEFLGDRVLGLAMAEALFKADMSAAEGQLAPRFNALVRKEACAEIAREIDLGAVLKLGRSEMMSGGRRKEALLGDAMEAVLAAVYLDAGFDATKTLIETLWKKRIETVDSDARDPKTALQEYVQARGQKPPAYSEIGRSGPDHAPIFEIQVKLESGESDSAKAGAKRHAEQEAARKLLSKLGA